MPSSRSTPFIFPESTDGVRGNEEGSPREVENEEKNKQTQSLTRYVVWQVTNAATR